MGSEGLGLVAFYSGRKYLMRDVGVYGRRDNVIRYVDDDSPCRNLMLYCFALPDEEIRPGIINYIFLYVSPPRFMFAHGISTKERVGGRKISAWMGEDIALDEKVAEMFRNMSVDVKNSV
jgi:hypothetical protein